MTKPVFLVDFNEMLEPDLVLLAKEDTKIDSHGVVVPLKAGMEVALYMDDTGANGHPDNLVASGVVELNRSTGWSAHVKWCCRIDVNGVRHQSEL
jgi:hypothetical protein